MKYDFTSILDRRGKDAIAIDAVGVTGLKPENIGYENGVLGGVVSAMNVLCSKGDSVLLHSPTYISFTHCLTDNGYHIVHSPLVKVDFRALERMAADKN